MCVCYMHFDPIVFTNRVFTHKAYARELEKFEHITDSNWAKADLYFKFSRALRRTRDFDAAGMNIRHALFMFPRFTRAREEKAAIEMDMGFPHTAVTTLELLLAIDRKYPKLDFLLTRATAHRQRHTEGSTATATGTHELLNAAGTGPETNKGERLYICSSSM